MGVDTLLFSREEAEEVKGDNRRDVSYLLYSICTFLYLSFYDLRRAKNNCFVSLFLAFMLEKIKITSIVM